MSSTRSPRNLTQPELRHLLELLHAARSEGSYFGNRRQYRDRELRLIRWVEEQVEAKGDE
jgi:hypothetical protein